MAIDPDKAQQALRRTHLGEAFKEAQTTGNVSKARMEALEAASEGLARSKLRTGMLGAKEIGLLVKNVAELRVASSLLRQDAQNRVAQTSAIRTFLRLESQRRALNVAGANMPAVLANQRLGAMNILSRALGTDVRGLPAAIDRLRQSLPDENEPGGGGGRGGRSRRGFTFYDLARMGASRGGMGATAAFMGTFGGEVAPKVPLPMLAAITAAVAAIEFPKMMLAAQGALTGKYAALGEYAQTTATINRYSGLAGGTINPMTDRSLGRQAINRLFPTMQSDQAFADAVLTSRFAVRNGGEAQGVVNALQRAQAQGGPGGLGGLSDDQTALMFSRMFQLGIAKGRPGGDIWAPNGLSAMETTFQRTFQRGTQVGFDKSEVANQILNALDTMAKGGVVLPGFAQNLYGAAFAGRGLFPGLANPAQTTEAIGTLGQIGRGVLNNPSMFMAGRAFISNNYKGGTFYDKLKDASRKNPALAKLMKDNPAWSGEQIFTYATQSGMFMNQIPAWITGALGKGTFASAEALQGQGFTPQMAYQLARGGAIPITGTALYGMPSGAQTFLNLQKRMFGKDRTGLALQKFSSLLQSSPAEAARMLQGPDGQILQAALKPLMDAGVIGRNINDLMMSQTTPGGMVGRGPNAVFQEGTTTFPNLGKLSGLLMKTSELTGKQSAEALAQAATEGAPEGVQAAQNVVTSSDLLDVQQMQAQLTQNLLKVSTNWKDITIKLDGHISQLNTTIQNWLSSRK